MAQPFDELSCNGLLERGDAFLEAVAGREDVAPVAAFFAIAHDELRQSLHDRRAACAVSEEAYRSCERADCDLDATIADLSLAALDLTGGDHRDPRFARLFPEGPQAYTCAPLEEEIGLVGELRDRLRGHPLQRRFDESLATGNARLELAARQLTAALDAEAKAWGRCRKAEMAWRLRGRLARATLDRQLRDDPALLRRIDELLPLPGEGDTPVSSQRR